MRFSSLIEKFKSADVAYLANKKDLKDVIGENLSLKFIDFRRKFDPIKRLEELKKNNIFTLPINSHLYPETLKNIPDPPICIYVRGDTEVLKTEQIFAIVGTRQPTYYGIKIARKFSQDLSEAGFTIISGLALGIDSVAHKSALETGGKTIAILGCGVDIVYPATNLSLYKNIIRCGAVISEFPPGHTVLKGLFIARNRIISGLSKGVFVVEGGSHSGALITASYAASQGKEVFAAPSPIDCDMSVAPNLLLKQGARLVTSPKDIFDELGIKITPKKKEDVFIDLTEKEKAVFNILETGPLSANSLKVKLSTSIDGVLQILSQLEIKGVIEKNTENKYQIRP